MTIGCDATGRWYRWQQGISLDPTSWSRFWVDADNLSNTLKPIVCFYVELEMCCKILYESRCCVSTAHIIMRMRACLKHTRTPTGRTVNRKWRNRIAILAVSVVKYFTHWAFILNTSGQLFSPKPGNIRSIYLGIYKYSIAKSETRYEISIGLYNPSIISRIPSWI